MSGNPSGAPSTEASARPTWRERWRESLERENRMNADAMRLAREQGPVTMFERFLRGEVGGPLTRRLYHLLPAVALMPRQMTVAVWLGPAALAFAVLAGTDDTLDSRMGWRITLGVVAVTLGIVGGAGAYALALKSTRQRVLGLVGRWGLKDLWWFGALLILLPTVAFASVSALLVGGKAIGSKGVSPADPGLAFKTFETYLWSLADAVPVLKVTETLNWKPQLSFPTLTGGALVLAYKLVLVLPFAQLAAIGISRMFGAEPEEPPEAGREVAASEAEPDS